MTTNYDLGFNAGLDEASRVALVLEEKWRNSAKSLRERRSWKAEQDAKSIDAAANGIAAIRRVLEGRKRGVAA